MPGFFLRQNITQPMKLFINHANIAAFFNVRTNSN